MRSIGEQGAVDGSLLTVHWLWSEEQRKKINCLTHAERVEECQKIASKREAFLREKGTTSEELFSLGFLPNPYVMGGKIPNPYVMSGKRERAKDRSDEDRYHLYRRLTGAPCGIYGFEKEEIEEGRMLEMGTEMVCRLGVRPEQIEMHKELDIRSGECKVMVTVVSLESDT